jgi:hypothetical protein
MKPPSSKLQGQQVQATTAHQQAVQQAAGLEFASVEEMMRHDARQNPPPPELAHRVAESVAGLPKPARSWWQKWFTGG